MDGVNGMRGAMDDSPDDWKDGWTGRTDTGMGGMNDEIWGEAPTTRRMIRGRGRRNRTLSGNPWLSTLPFARSSLG